MYPSRHSKKYLGMIEVQSAWNHDKSQIGSDKVNRSLSVPIGMTYELHILYWKLLYS